MNISASRFAQMIFCKTKQIVSTKPFEISTSYIFGRYNMLKEIPKIGIKYNTDFKKVDVINHKKYNWLSCKPDGITNDGSHLLKIKYTENPKLCINYSDWIYSQIIMEISNVNKLVYSIGTSVNYATMVINRDQKWWNIIENTMLKNGRINVYNTRSTRQNTPFITDKLPIYNLHPYFHGDLLSYSLFLKNTRSEKSNGQKYRTKEYNKKYSALIRENMVDDSVIIPTSYEYIQHFEQMTLDGLEKNAPIVFNPMVSFDKYYYQSFALWKGPSNKYVLAIVAKKTDKFIDVLVKNMYNWCDNNGILHENYFHLVSLGKIETGDIVSNAKLISEYSIPSTFRLYKNGVIPVKNSKYFQNIHTEMIEQYGHVSKLLGIGPVKARALNKNNINTLSEFNNSDEPKTKHQENILNANFKNQIYPQTLNCHDILSSYTNESYIDAEFSPDRIVTFVSKDNNGQVRKWKLDEFTDDAERKMLKEILTELNKMDIVYHWGHADRTQITKAINRLNMDDYVPNMCDAYTLLKKNNLGIPGCWNMKLKSVAKALYNLGKIDTFHEDVLDGQDMVCQFLKWDRKEEFYDNNGDIIQKILKYNYYDVETMKQIIDWVRVKYA